MAQVLNINRRGSPACENVSEELSTSSNPQPALGAAVRVLRAKKHATQEAVAQTAGITVAHLSKIERGRTNPTWGTLVAIASALDVSMAILAEQHDILKAAGR